MRKRARNSAGRRSSRRRHDLGHDMRALAAAEHDQPQRRAGRRRGVSAGGGRDHLRAHRIAGEADLGLQTRIEIGERVEAGGNGRDARRQEAIGAAHDAVLLVQHRRHGTHARRQQRRHGRVAAEADHHGGTNASDHAPGFHGAEREQAQRAGERKWIAAAHGRARNDVHGARRKLEMRGARVGRELDERGALFQRDGERLRRKQMAAGAAGAEEDELIWSPSPLPPSCPGLSSSGAIHALGASKDDAHSSQTWMRREQARP